MFCLISLVGGASSPIQIFILEMPEDVYFESSGVYAVHVSLSVTWVPCRIIMQTGKFLVPQDVVRDAVGVVLLLLLLDTE